MKSETKFVTYLVVILVVVGAALAGSIFYVREGQTPVVTNPPPPSPTPEPTVAESLAFIKREGLNGEVVPSVAITTSTTLDKLPSGLRTLTPSTAQAIKASSIDFDDDTEGFGVEYTLNGKLFDNYVDFVRDHMPPYIFVASRRVDNAGILIMSDNQYKYYLTVTADNESVTNFNILAHTK